MDTKFFNNFFVLLSPDSVFKKTLKEEAIIRPLFSTFFATAFFSSFCVYIYRLWRIPGAGIKPFAFLAIINIIYLAILALSIMFSAFFDWVYTRTIKIRDQALRSDFRSNFICHLYVLPYWMLLMFVYFLFFHRDVNITWLFGVAILIIRLLDIKARMVKIVYKLRLIQGYTIVFSEFLLILSGIGLGVWFLQTKWGMGFWAMLRIFSVHSP